MTGIAALALSAGFTSCSHDIEPMTQEEINQIEAQKIVQTYEQAFIKTFGQPAANQNWGFGSDAYTTRAAFTRAVPGITFPTFRDNSCPTMPTQYSNTVPAGAIYAKTYAEEHPHDKFPEGAVIYINEAYPQFWGENQVGNVDNLIIYVDGNITLNESFSQNKKGTTLCVTKGSTLKLQNVRENLTVYLAPNAKLDLSECTFDYYNPETYQTSKINGAAFTKGTAALYMSTGSRVEGGAIYFKDDYTVLNEGGTIDVGELHVENGAILYNKKKIDVDGVIALRNTKGEIVNYDEIDAASMTLDAGAKFYNVAGGQVDITGLTKLNNDSGTNAWQNGGKFNTGSFEITGGCQDPAAFNNCHMTVTGQFFMNHGNFVLDSGAAVECGSFKWVSDNYFHMGSKALLNVTGQLLADNWNTGYGFYGDGADYAVIQAGSIAKENEGKFRAAYFGKLFIDTNNHFPQGRSSADGTWYTWNDPVKFSFTDNNAEGAQKATNFSIDIPADAEGCTPGYHWGDNTPTADLRIMAEDLSASDDTDFDFNDIVFDVYYGAAGTAKIEVLAAGGTLPLRIKTGAGNTDADFEEVHGMFGQNTNIMINTNASYANSKSGLASVSRTLPYAVNSAADAKNITIQVKKTVDGKEQWIEMKAEVSKPAAKFACLPSVVKRWADERESLLKNSNFKDWVQGAIDQWQWNDDIK